MRATAVAGERLSLLFLFLGGWIRTTGPRLPFNKDGGWPTLLRNCVRPASGESGQPPGIKNDDGAEERRARTDKDRWKTAGQVARFPESGRSQKGTDHCADGRGGRTLSLCRRPRGERRRRRDGGDHHDVMSQKQRTSCSARRK